MPYGRAVLFCGFGVIVLSALWLLLTSNTGIRFSADSNDTVPMWNLWIPVIIGLLLVRLVPLSIDITNPLLHVERRIILSQARVLAVLAVAFPILLYIAVSATGSTEPWYLIIKVALLLIAPFIVFLLLRSARDSSRQERASRTLWRRFGPVIPVTIWFYLTFFSPLAVPYSPTQQLDVATLLVTVVIVFLVNAVLEEYFYRVWLQTRFEIFLGSWASMVVCSLLWASWHVAIQGQGRLDLDLAGVFVNQGISGLFLGYLWTRYRNVWPLLIVHGSMNSVPLFLSLL